MTGPSGEDMRIIGRTKIDIEIGGKIFNIECVGIEEVKADLLLNFDFLKKNLMEIEKRENEHYLRLRRAGVEVRLEDFQPSEEDVKTLTVREQDG